MADDPRNLRERLVQYIIPYAYRDLTANRGIKADQIPAEIIKHATTLEEFILADQEQVKEKVKTPKATKGIMDNKPLELKDK